MSEQTLNVKILLRNDTSANWKTKNPVLKNGELGIETDTRLMKFGDGTSTWTNLNYIDAQIASNVAWSGVTDKPSTYPPADHNHDSSYPSITGNRASGTWGINISGNAVSSTNASHASNADETTHAASATAVNATAPAGQTKDLVSAVMANNDAFRIQVGDTGGDNGYVSFDTCDNGDEPIYFRQYTGAVTFDNIVRQVTLLDGNGNTTFPGTVSAPKFSGNGADYAEFFEWSDGNTDNEDRVGYFVTLDTGLKIRKAKSTDTYVLGIVSGEPSVVGNSYQDDWNNKYIKDSFGRIQYTSTTVDGVTTKTPQLNHAYDPTKEYIPREQRKEWSIIGMLGQLAVYDDGTCKANEYCKVDDNGKATAATAGYRVLERISANVIKVLFK